jgi:hypothetical protein
MRHLMRLTNRAGFRGLWLEYIPILQTPLSQSPPLEITIYRHLPNPLFPLPHTKSVILMTPSLWINAFIGFLSRKKVNRYRNGPADLLSSLARK